MFHIASAEEVRPEHCFSRESGVLPLDFDLTAGWSLVTPQGARQRVWLGNTTVDPSTVERWVDNAIAEEGATYITQVVQRVQEQHGNILQQTLLEAVQHVVQAGRTMTLGWKPDQSDRPPDLMFGTSAVLHHVRPEDVVITTAETPTRGWVTAPPNGFRLSGRDGAAILLPLLRQIGGLYARGAHSAIAHLDLSIWRSLVAAAYDSISRLFLRRR
jgi:hypothetical protein